MKLFTHVFSEPSILNPKIQLYHKLAKTFQFAITSTHDVIQSNTSQLSSLSKGSSVAQVQVHETSSILQVQKEMVPRFTPMHALGFVFIIS